MKSKTYIDEFIKLKCAPDMLALGLFPNAKEITESMGMFNAVRRLKLADPADKNVLLISIGDGCTPRTAALFAFRTAWQCISIDPALRERSRYRRIKRLEVFPHRVEGVGWYRVLEHTSPTATKAIVVMVHSHAPMKSVICFIDEQLPDIPVSILTMPCCEPHDIPGRPYWGITDTRVWSPKNTIKVWLDVTRKREKA